MRHRRRNWTTVLVSWQLKTSSVWFYLSNGCRTRNPAALTAGFHLFPSLRQDTSGSPVVVDDRTDDCAFGAMMSPALRPKFRKLRFQMIDDTIELAEQTIVHLRYDKVSGTLRFGERDGGG